MRFAFALVCATLAIGCGWPSTRMEPVADYGAATRPTISSAPSYTAGTNYVRTYSPDGATLFVCEYGGTRPGRAVMPGSTPAC